MSQIKTLGEWAETLPKDLEEKVKEYCMFNLDTPQTSLKILLGCSFSWDDTEEGNEYWENIYNTYTDGIRPTDEEVDENVEIQGQWMRAQKELVEQVGGEMPSTFQKGKEPTSHPILDLMEELISDMVSKEPALKALEAVSFFDGKKRTIEERLKRVLPQDIAEKAIQRVVNGGICTLDEVVPNDLVAIKGTFTWSDTPEGFDYWNEVCEEYFSNI